MQQFPGVAFYDYTKRLPRMLSFLKGEMPANYSLTFSRSESNGAKAELVASMGGNVAVVFDSANYPAAFYGRPTVNGDETDLRFLDPKGVIVALYAKGLAKRDSSGFVVETAPALAMAA